MNAEDRLKQMMDSARAESSVTGAEWRSFVNRAHRTLYARRAAAALGAVVLVGLGAFAANAFLSDDLSPAPLPPVGTPTGTVEPTPTVPAEPTTVEIPVDDGEHWLVDKDGRLLLGMAREGGQVPLDLSGSDERAQKAVVWLRSLIYADPETSQPRDEATAIPVGTELLGVSAADGPVLNVDLSSEFGSGGGSLSMQLRVAQIVYTGTQFEGVDSVQILIDGQQQDALGGEGIDISRPLTRRDFQDLAPNIVVETPKPNAEFRSGDVISGFANVFEANVSWRILGPDGEEIPDQNGFTTATCGSGCWGDFEITPGLTFNIGPEGLEGTIEVLTFSAEDGSPQDIVSIPVTFVP